MPFHAHYLPGDPTSTSTSDRSVSLKELAALGWEIQLSENPQDVEQLGRKLAQEQGYPLTEDSIAPYSFKLAVADSPQAFQHLFTKVAQISPETGFAVKLGAIVTVTEASLQLDVEDTISKSWIRLELSSGVVHVVPGARYHALIHENHDAVGVVFVNGSLADLDLVHEDLENHEVRKAYLGSIGQA